jgi:hypothetical protein
MRLSAAQSEFPRQRYGFGDQLAHVADQIGQILQWNQRLARLWPHWHRLPLYGQGFLVKAPYIVNDFVAFPDYRFCFLYDGFHTPAILLARCIGRFRHCY